MLSKFAKSIIPLCAGALLWSAAAEAASPLTLTVSGSVKMPAKGSKIPTKLPRTTLQAFPVEGTTNDITPISGKASAAGRKANRAGVAPMAYGISSEKWPYSASRVASTTNSLGTSALENPVTAAPYRQTGLMLMDFQDGTYQCTASLILPNVLVTAAHCVQDYGLGAAGSAHNIQWIPANMGDPTDPAQRPFGVWTADRVVISDSYYNGTDTCARNAVGVVCNNDIAVIVLNRQAGDKAATILGDAYMYGWNGYSYIKSPAFKNLTVADITELGYPVAFDNGEQMQRNASFGKYTVSKGKATTTRKPLLNTQLGTPLTGGSSGGPWLVNFGTRPTVSSEASLGNDSLSNVVVGVTSWGYTATGYNVQGSSFFGQNYEFPLAAYGIYGGGNIGALVQAACTAVPEACLD
ncbi:trypsin-like serine peptidase [Aestuariivirga litoralis]|nr:trypsin-like serine protease [Aestuariivirga litoralis]